MATGDIIKLGSIKYGSGFIPIPDKPYWILPGSSATTGNIRSGVSRMIYDTQSEDSMKVRWVEVNVDGKTLLICDRVLTTNVLPGDLPYNVEIMIDGKKYILRYLTGGKVYDFSPDNDKSTNEWDRFILNTDDLPGLPKPQDYDLDKKRNVEAFTGAHNSLWNWVSMGTWAPAIHSSTGLYRGMTTASGRDTLLADSAANRNNFIGWRPVLEVLNKAPSIMLKSPESKTMYENDTLLVEGSAKDTDKNDIVNVYYQINATAAQPIQTRISDGVTDIPFSEQLTFKGGKLHLPDGTALTGALTEGIAQKLKVWSEDNKGGKSTVEERTFYVVPNRPPNLTINPFTAASDLIDNDKVTITGTTSDPDGNDTVVSYKLNNGLATEIYRGPDSDWSFDLQLSSLKLGENTAVVETVDAYNFKTSLTRKLKKTANLTPLAKSVQRYTLIPPAGTAQGLLLWIERHPEQAVTVEISMTNGTEQEQYVAMTLDSSGPSDMAGRVEDFFKHRADLPAEKIAIKLSWTGDKPIYRITGALTQ